MGNDSKRASRRTDQLIGLYQMVAAATGLAILVAGSGRANQRVWEAVPFILAAVAGALLTRGIRFGRELSVFVLFAQVPLWLTATSAWRFCTGVYLQILVAQGRSAVGVGINASFIANGGEPDATPFVGLNVIPAVIAGLLIAADFMESRSHESAAIPM